MEYYVYDGSFLTDVITLDIDSKELFESKNPHLRLEECDESPILFEEDIEDLYE